MLTPEASAYVLIPVWSGAWKSIGRIQERLEDLTYEPVTMASLRERAELEDAAAYLWCWLLRLTPVYLLSSVLQDGRTIRSWPMSACPSQGIFDTEEARIGAEIEGRIEAKRSARALEIEKAREHAGISALEAERQKLLDEIETLEAKRNDLADFHARKFERELRETPITELQQSA